MPTYQWRGRAVTGEIRKGIMEAPTEQVVEVYLRRLNIVPIKIQPKKEKGFSLQLKRVSDKDVTLFTRQFATILEAGVPIVKGLETLAMQQKKSLLSEYYSYYS